MRRNRKSVYAFELNFYEVKGWCYAIASDGRYMGSSGGGVSLVKGMLSSKKHRNLNEFRFFVSATNEEFDVPDVSEVHKILQKLKKFEEKKLEESSE